jgi:ATP-dependent Clp protease ATP-binding subunit ClpB
MNLERYTEQARQAIAQSQVLARESAHSQIDLPHLAAVMLRDAAGLPAKIVQKAGQNPQSIYQAAQSELGRLPKVSGTEGGQYLSSRLASALGRAEKLADELKDRFVALDTLLLALAETGYGGLQASAVRQALQEIRGEEP